MTEKRAAIYCRLSRARDGTTVIVEEQERLCRALAGQRGLTVIEPVFIDNDTTAAKGNSRSKPRDGYNDLIEAISAGKVDAVLALHTDRLHRNWAELQEYIEVCGEGRRGIPTYTVRGGDLDLSTSNGRMVARILASIAQGEIEHMIERMLDGHERRRRKGIVRGGGPGGRAYGFGTDGLTIIEAEAAIVREAAARILAGEHTGAICRDFTGRGIVTVTGIPFAHGTLRKMLARSRYAGLMPDGMSPAAWPAILERDQWEAVRAALDARAAGFGYASNTSKYLLSGIAECGACGTRMHYKNSKGRGRARYQTGYACNEPGCRKTWRDMALLDAYVHRMTWNRLTDPGNPEPSAPEAPDLAAEFAALTAQLAEVDDALADHTRGAVPALLARRGGIERRIGELRELAAGDAAARLRTAHRGVSWPEFLVLPLATRRALVSSYFRIVVLPASKRGPGFRSQDVEMTPL